MLAFLVQMPSAARLTEARPNAKTNTSKIVFFILLSFQKMLDFSLTAETAKTAEKAKITFLYWYIAKSSATSPFSAVRNMD